MIEVREGCQWIVSYHGHLMGGDGKSMPYQLTTDGGVVRLAAIKTKHSDSIAYI